MQRAIVSGVLAGVLCALVAVPALAAEDHLKCYKVRDTVRLRGPAPAWLDLTGPQFGTEQCKIVGGFRLFCVPVTKTVTQPIERLLTDLGGGYQSYTPAPVANPEPLTEDKICYKIKCTNPAPVPPNPSQDVFDQFGNRILAGFKPFLLCGPAVKGTRFVASLDGAQETPPSGSAGTGSCTLVLNEAQTQLQIDCTFSGLGSAEIAAHIHNAPVGVPGPIVFPLPLGSPKSATWVLTPADVGSLMLGNLYVNIHSSGFPGGEIRGQITLAP